MSAHKRDRVSVIDAGWSEEPTSGVYEVERPTFCTDTVAAQDDLGAFSDEMLVVYTMIPRPSRLPEIDTDPYLLCEFESDTFSLDAENE